MNAPLVSVIIPTYNRDAVLRTAIASVLNQTYPNFELIVVDDHSQKPTHQLLTDITDSRLRTIRHDANQGISVARNTGIAHAKGELIALLDDDDLWYPPKLEKQVNCLTSNKGQVDGCLTDFIVQDSGQTEYIRNSKENPSWVLLTNSTAGMGSTMMVPKTVFEDIGGFNPEFKKAQDWEWLLRFHSYGKRMSVIPEFLCMYSGGHVGFDTALASYKLIEAKYGHALGDPRERNAFETALQWKRARVELSHHSNRQQVVKTFLPIAISHPINFWRQLRRSSLSRHMGRLLSRPVPRPQSAAGHTLVPTNLS